MSYTLPEPKASVTTPLSSLAPAVAKPEVLAQIDAAITGAVSAEEKKVKKDKVEKSRKGDLFKIVHDYQRRSIEFADRKATFIVFGANAFASFLEKTRGLSAMRSAPWSSCCRTPRRAMAASWKRSPR